MVVDIKADVVDGIHRLAALTERLGHMREPYLSHASTLRDPSGPRGPSGPSDTLATMQHETTPPLEINVDLNVDLDVDLNQVERDLRTFFQGEPTLDRVITEYAKARAQQEISFRDWARESHLLDSPKKK